MAECEVTLLAALTHWKWPSPALPSAQEPRQSCQQKVKAGGSRHASSRVTLSSSVWPVSFLPCHGPQAQSLSQGLVPTTEGAWAASL